MEKRKLKKSVRIILRAVSALIILFFVTVIVYNVQLSGVDRKGSVVEFTIKEGSSVNSIISDLEEEGLIRNITMTKIYLKLNNINNLQAGSYDLSSSYSTKKIIDMISTGKVSTKDEINLTFKEGKNIRDIAKVISEKTVNSEDDVFNLLKDTEYIDSLIDSYWFITDEIKNSNMYYPLEGYLFPDTYRFRNNNVTVEEIFTKMLDQMDTVLTPYKKDINNKEFTVHEFLTLASIVESEGVSNSDRPTIASVFYNRLDIGMSLGSCATACYAAKFDGVCAPKNVDTGVDSPYNTYLSSMAGKLPVGPISSPGEASIEASLNPSNTEYLFFMSDKYRKTYFSKTSAEQNQKIETLKKSGKWFE